MASAEPEFFRRYPTQHFGAPVPVPFENRFIQVSKYYPAGETNRGESTRVALVTAPGHAKRAM